MQEKLKELEGAPEEEQEPPLQDSDDELAAQFDNEFSKMQQNRKKFNQLNGVREGAKNEEEEVFKVADNLLEQMQKKRLELEKLK